MNYVVSDLHGCYEKFRKLLEMIHLQDKDTLYVLGDVVDRGPENVKLIAELAAKKNIVTLMGNHDYLGRIMLQAYGMPAKELSDTEREDRDRILESGALHAAWLDDGGGPTLEEFKRLTLPEKKLVLRFLQALPLFTELEAGGQYYFLSHTVPDKETMRDLERRKANDYLYGVPDYDKVYYDDKILVTGHTPTGLIDPSFVGRIWRKNNHIAVDCGAVFGNPLGCICLETGEEYYAQ